MLAELFDYYTTPSSQMAKELGYLKESIAIEARYKRCANDWREHLENTKEAILKAASECKQRRKVIILGSGGLYDIPYEELGEMFNKVVLVDMVHTKRAREIAENFKNFTLREDDISGVNYGLFKINDNYDPEIPQNFLSDKNIDLVVSANILSQLPILPRKFFAKNKNFSEERLDRLCENIQLNHLKYLDKFPCKKCVITDYKRKVFDKSGEFLEQSDALYGLEVPDATDSWLWNVAPSPEENRKLTYKNEVICKIY